MPVTTETTVYKRILLKLSGEALTGKLSSGIDPAVLARVAAEIKQLADAGIEVGVVIGGGNLFRGTTLQQAGLARVTGDQMGMLATVMNGLALRDALEKGGTATKLMSSIAMPGVAEQYDRHQAVRHLAKKRVVIFSAGTGNPLFTTDTAACLRGIETGVDVVLKATKVDGIYDRDPVSHADALKFDHLTYDEVLDRKLGVMDLTAICLVREHDIPVRVFNMNKQGALAAIMSGDSEGTVVCRQR